MLREVTHITILVRQYSEALEFYTQKLGFSIHTDAAFGQERWLTLRLPDQPHFEVVLAQAKTQEDFALVGKQGGSYGLAIIATDNCLQDYKTLKARSVDFIGEPKDEPWGIGVSFKDLYGNTFYLNQPK